VPYALVIGARYIDRFERRGDMWRIADRQGRRDWRVELPIAIGETVAGEDPATAVATACLRTM
jgi:hypothetical protein